MNENFIPQLNNINYNLSQMRISAQNFVNGGQDISSQLNQIRISLGQINSSFVSYQSTIINQPWFQFVIGSIVTLVAAWVLQYVNNRKSRKEYLYYLQRVIVDQINAVIDARLTVGRFIDVKITTLIKNIKNNPAEAYSIETTFFPLFSVRSLSDRVHGQTSGSGYIDNKIGKIYSISCDLPYIMDDIRLQFKDTLERNEKIAIGKLNSPEIQKKQYIDNLREFERMLRNEILEINFPLFVKKLAETLVAVEEKATSSSLYWKLRFDPRWKFYWRQDSYLQAKKGIMNTLDKYFETRTDKLLREIEDNLKM